MTSRQNPGRKVAVLLHPSRTEAVDAALDFARRVAGRGVECSFQASRVAELRDRVPDLWLGTLPDPDDDPVSEFELVIVFGGDGTILAASDWALPQGIPLLGVNLGHVGFLAELESSEISGLADQVVNRDYAVEERLALAIEVSDGTGRVVWRTHVVNEVSIEKAAREKMIELLVHVDGRPLSRWGCDGVLVSTPTGSTAYAFSAGGPVMWPDVEAILLVPIAAHALFSRPLVLSPQSRVDLDISAELPTFTVVWVDGRRTVDVPAGGRVTVTRHARNLRLARLRAQPFTDRLVRKFGLPVNGWR